MRRLWDRYCGRGSPAGRSPIGPAVRAALWCRRHPLPSALTALLVLSVLGGFAGVTWKWRAADREAARSARLVEYLNRLLTQSSLEAQPYPANLTVRELLDRAASTIEGDFQDRPELEAAVRETIGGAYTSLGELSTAERHLWAAVRLDAQVYGPQHPATLHALNRLGALLVAAGPGRAREAEALLRRNLRDCLDVLGPDSPDTAEAADQLGCLLRATGRPKEAEDMFRVALTIRLNNLKRDHPDTLRTARHLSLVLAERGEFFEAELMADKYEYGIRRTFGPNHPENVSALAHRGRIWLLRHRPEMAEPYYRQMADEARRILGPDHPRTREAAAEHARVAALLRTEAAPADPKQIPESPPGARPDAAAPAKLPAHL